MLVEGSLERSKSRPSMCSFVGGSVSGNIQVTRLIDLVGLLMVYLTPLGFSILPQISSRRVEFLLRLGCGFPICFAQLQYGG